MDRTLQDIHDHINSLEIIDTHEHLPGTEAARPRPTDVLTEYLSHYFNRDLISAGLPEADFRRVIDHTQPLAERWALVEPYWEHARHTGYGLSLETTVQGLYGIERIDGSTIEPLNEAFQRSLEPGAYRRVLKDKCRIRVSLNNEEGEMDPEFFLRAYHVDDFILPRTWNDIRTVEQESGVLIRGFDDWLEAAEAVFERLPQMRVGCLKSALAYERPLRYDRVTRSEAEAGFNQGFAGLHLPDWGERPFAVPKAFQDYMMHFILRLAGRTGYTFQFHTGLQEGNGNLIYNSDPALLSNLFLEYPDVGFDLFHIGYPYLRTLGVLAKNFPNVYIDMCWAHIVSPTAAVAALVEWLDLVPANKISAFGGDYCFVDAVYGHQLWARGNVARALTIKVEQGVFNVDRACRIGEMLFVDNPMAIFRLEGKL